MRVDIFKSKAAAEKNIKDSHQWETLSPEEQRLVAKMVRIIVISIVTVLIGQLQVLDGTRAGLALPAEKQSELMILQKELSQVCLECQVYQIPQV